MVASLTLGQLYDSQSASDVTWKDDIDGLLQDGSNSSALAMELLQYCTKPLLWLKWVIKFNGLSWTAESEVHVVHISHLIWLKSVQYLNKTNHSKAWIICIILAITELKSIIYTLTQQSWREYTGFTLSVSPSVHRTMSALYFLQYSSDPFHIYTSYQATAEGVFFFKINFFCHFF